ncbi:MAG: CDP-glycerol glycerophosphotransferase family protein [Colwellia sp.]
MDKIKLLINVVINLSFYLITKCIPKKNNLWVFGGWFGNRYSDNSKAFFEYINNEQNHIEAVWICKDEQVIEHVRSLGLTAFHEKSVTGLWCQLRAKFAFVCQSLHDDIYAPCIGKKTTVVNLWHGLPLKKIMYDVFGDKVVKKNLVGKFFDKLSPYEKIRNDYLLATSEETQNTLSKAFRLPKERTLITGFPRNDIFLKPLSIPVTATPAPTNTSYKCIYMPTFRGGKGSECDLFAQYGFDVKMIDEQLIKNNIELVLRMHPVNQPPQYIIEEIKHSRSISIDNSVDIFDSIAQYDCMITDYSGGYFDFLLTGRPILFAPFDLEKYKEQERDLYYQYEDVTLAPYSAGWSEVIANVINVKNGQRDEEYQKEYDLLKELFHQPLNENYDTFSEKLYFSLLK